MTTCACRCSIASNDAMNRPLSRSSGFGFAVDDLLDSGRTASPGSRAGPRRPSTPWRRSGDTGCRTGCRRSRRCRARWSPAARARRTSSRRAPEARRADFLAGSPADRLRSGHASLTRHRNHFSGQVTGVVTGQERDGGRDLPRLGGPAERLAFGEPVEQLRSSWSSRGTCAGRCSATPR